MEILECCDLCREKENPLTILNCTHSICHDCFYLLTIYNYNSFMKSSKLEEKISFICIICETGYIALNKKDLFKVLSYNCKKKIIICNNSGHKKEINFYCIDCKWPMCVDCKIFHETKIPIKHRILNYEDYFFCNMCVKHPHEKCDIKCKQCHELICKICHNTLHSSHLIEYLVVDSAITIQEIKQSNLPFDNFDKLTDFMLRKKNEIYNELNEYSINFKDQIQNIQEKLNHISKLYDDTKSEYIDNLEISTKLIESVYKKYYENLDSLSWKDQNKFEAFKKLKLITKPLDCSYYWLKISKNIENLNTQLNEITEKINNIYPLDFIPVSIFFHKNWQEEKSIKNITQKLNGDIVLIFEGKIKVYDCKEYKLKYEKNLEIIDKFLELSRGNIICNYYSKKSKFSLSYEYFLNIYDSTENRLIKRIQYEKQVVNFIEFRDEFLAVAYESYYGLELEVMNIEENFKVFNKFTIKDANCDLLLLNNNLLAYSEITKIKLYDNSKMDNITIDEYKSIILFLNKMKNGNFISLNKDNFFHIYDSENYTCVNKINLNQKVFNQKFLNFLILPNDTIVALTDNNNLLHLKKNDNYGNIEKIHPKSNKIINKIMPHLNGMIFYTQYNEVEIFK